jgi:glycosyltransferase involved in cell wall biosynthesis
MLSAQAGIGWNNERVRIGQASWVCCQLGAREQYAVPRALHRIGALNCLLTDAWAPPGNLFGLVRRNLRARFHPDLATAQVQAWNAGLIAFELAARAKRVAGWPLIIARNRWFQRKVVSALRDYGTTGLRDDKSVVGCQSSGGPLVLFSYSYTALEPFRFAKAHGWKTVLGQIDPGPLHDEILADEALREPQFATAWKPAPTKYWTLWREECDLADRIIVNSQWSLQCLKHVGISEQKLRLVPLGFESPTGFEVPVKIYPVQFTNERPLRVLFLGQINLGKGIARLLKAAAIFRGEPIEFWLVGPLQIPNAVAAAADTRIRWIGLVGRESAGEYYRQADVFILPTLSDGFGLTQLEALAHKLPVIASRNCGQAVRHRVNGLLLEEPTAEAIKEGLQFCLKNPDQLARFSQNAMLSEEFSLARLGSNLSSIVFESSYDLGK